MNALDYLVAMLNHSRSRGIELEVVTASHPNGNGWYQCYVFEESYHRCGHIANGYRTATLDDAMKSCYDDFMAKFDKLYPHEE